MQFRRLSGRLLFLYCVFFEHLKLRFTVSTELYDIPYMDSIHSKFVHEVLCRAVVS